MSFAPAGTKSRADLVIDLADQHQDGSLIPYADLITTLGQVDDRDGRHRVYQAIRQANIKLKRRQRHLVVVKGEGYRIAESHEHQVIARRHEDRANKEIGKGLTLLENTDLTDMTPAQAQQHIGVTMVLTNVAIVLERERKRVDAHEVLLRRLAGQEGVPASEVDAILGVSDVIPGSVI